MYPYKRSIRNPLMSSPSRTQKNAHAHTHTHIQSHTFKQTRMPLAGERCLRSKPEILPRKHKTRHKRGYALRFFFINWFPIKGQNGCVNRIMQTSARKYWQSFFPIQPNRDPPLRKKKLGVSVAFGHNNNKEKIINRNVTNYIIIKTKKRRICSV